MGNIYWSNGVTTTTNTVNPSQTTTYIVAALSGTGCAATDTVTVNVNPVPNISISDEIICEGDTATLVAIPDIIGGVYSWSPGGASTDTLLVSPLSTTSYFVDYSINGCSSSTVSALVTVNPIPQVSLLLKCYNM